jgi:hypothetical protein
MTRTEPDIVVCRQDVRRANGRESAADLAALLLSAAVIGARLALTYTVRCLVEIEVRGTARDGTAMLRLLQPIHGNQRQSRLLVVRPRLIAGSIGQRDRDGGQ